MLIQRLFNALVEPKIITLPELVQSFGYANAAGQTVTAQGLRANHPAWKTSRIVVIPE